MKKIILANPRGFCAGVHRAIAIVEKAISRYGTPIYVRHEVVHNKYVVNDLKNRGAIFVEDLKDVPSNSVLIYSAHGVPLCIREEASKKNLKIILDATCPLVNKVHVEIKVLNKEGYTIIMIGHKGHPEVEGAMGQISSGIYLIESEKDIDSLSFLSNTAKIAVVTQTTLSIDDTRELIRKLKIKFPTLKLPNKEDICYATQNRQNAVKALAFLCDIVFIIGSKNSSNSNRLKELVTSLGKQSYLIDFAHEIDLNLLRNVCTLGVTAGASAPEILVNEVVEVIKMAGFNLVEEQVTASESMVFALPENLRD